jgi:two-component system, cell cycle response regulator DivK
LPTSAQMNDQRDAPLILIVDDNPDSHVIYGTVMKHFGYQVLVAEDGQEAIQKAKREGPDLIVMDLSMPGLDGLRATEVLKDDPATKDIPILVLTASASKEDRIRLDEIGCEAFLSKPAEPKTVAQEVQRLLGKRSAG